LGDIPKSGLGSSSALIVSSLGSLLKEFKVEGRLMELSYKANHLAQKKIGSGFDIATSINGT
jgi:phosphomevalonate kinase